MPVIGVDDNPEFPHSVHTLLNISLFDIVSVDVNLVNYFVGEIAQIQSEEIKRLGSVNTPSLWQYLLEDSEEAQPSQTADVTTVISFLLVDTYLRHTGTNDDRNRRILAYVQALIHGQLEIRDDTDLLLTDNVIQSRVVEAAAIRDSNSYVMELQMVFGSTIDQITQLPIADT